MDGIGVARGFKLLSGSANRALADEIARCIGVELTKVTLSRFTDGEIFVRIDENIRGSDIFIVQPTNPPADNVLELLLLIDAARRASAARITCVLPYYGYSRQDRKDQPRVAIGAKLVANLITVAGAHRVLTMDLHAGQIQGFFDIPLDHLYAAPVIVSDIKSNYKEKNVVIVSPDVGGVVRARALAKRLNADLAIVDKRRERAGVSEVMNVIGDIEGRHCILIDDIVDSAGTLCNAAEALKKGGAVSVAAYVTHGVLAGKALERVAGSALTSLVITDSIATTEAVKAAKNIRVISVAPLLAEAIRRISEESSVSSLFD